MDTVFSAKLQQKLAEFGTKNGFAPPQSQDPLDPILHEYFVASLGYSIMEKRRKAILERMMVADTQEIVQATIDSVKKTKIAQSATLFQTPHYVCNLTVRAPAARFDKTAAANELMKLGVSRDVIERAFEKASTHNQPAKVFAVSPA